MQVAAAILRACAPERAVVHAMLVAAYERREAKFLKALDDLGGDVDINDVEPDPLSFDIEAAIEAFSDDPRPATFYRIRTGRGRR